MYAPRFSVYCRPGQSVAAAYAEACAKQSAPAAQRSTALMLAGMAAVLALAFAYALLMRQPPQAAAKPQPTQEVPARGLARWQWRYD